MRHARLSWWWQPFGALGVTAAIVAMLEPGPWGSGILIAVGLVAAWWISPLRSTVGTPHHEAMHRAHADDAVVVYWRPGCPFCARLRRGLGGMRREVLWVNIWADADAAAYVRSVNGGNETVPTVVFGNEGVATNPEPEEVRHALSTRSSAREA